VKKSMTKRQALFLLIICFLANKTQRLPSLISANVGRHGWIVFLIMGALEVLLLSLTLLVNKYANGRTVYGVARRAGGDIFAKIIMIVLGLYFLVNAILPYESVHDVFSNVLFDYLPWELYSFIIIFAIGFLTCFGLTTMGRMSEIYLWLIGGSFILLLMLGASTTSFENVLPIYDVNFSDIFSTCFDYSLWFGDFLLLYIFMGRVKEDDGKMGWPFIVGITGCVLLLTFGYMIFYGLYQTLSSGQTNFITSISQFSLLNFEIGRVDWFFALFFEISTFISPAMYIYAASRCVCEVFNIKNEKIVCILATLVMYGVDIIFFKSIGQGASKIAYFARFAYPAIVITLPLVMLISAFVAKKKDSSQHKKLGEFKRVEKLFSKSPVKMAEIEDVTKEQKRALKRLNKTKKRGEKLCKN